MAKKIITVEGVEIRLLTESKLVIISIHKTI